MRESGRQSERAGDSERGKQREGCGRSDGGKRYVGQLFGSGLPRGNNLGDIKGENDIDQYMQKLRKVSTYRTKISHFFQDIIIYYFFKTMRKHPLIL